MVIGCYTLDVYCETENCRTNFVESRGKYEPCTYIGKHLKECLNAAHDDGWIFSEDGKKAWCSECVKNKKHSK